MFVGKPFVQTVDIHNLTEVEEALKEIISTEVRKQLVLIFFSMLEQFFYFFKCCNTYRKFSYFVIPSILDCNETSQLVYTTNLVGVDHEML